MPYPFGHTAHCVLCTTILLYLWQNIICVAMICQTKTTKLIMKERCCCCFNSEKLEKFFFKIAVLSLSPSVQQQSCLVDLWPVHMSPLYHPWENRQIIYDSFPPCFSPISLELDVFVLILKVHYWKENIGHPPCYCLVNFGSELRQSSFQLHFVQILASWWKRKQARKGHLVTWLPGHLTVTTWLPGFSKSWKHFSRWHLRCSHYLLSLGRKMPGNKINFQGGWKR